MTKKVRQKSYWRNGQATIFVWAFLLFTGLLLLVGCVHLRDAEIRKNVLGAWRLVQPPLGKGGLNLTLTFAPNSDFKREILIISNGVPFAGVVDMTGKFQIQDGYLIQTVTHMTVRRNAHLPLVLRSKIIQADDTELVLIPEGMTKTDILKKDTR